MDTTIKIQFDCSDRLEKVLREIVEGLDALKTPQATPRTRKAKSVTTTALTTTQEESKKEEVAETQAPKVEEKQQEEPKVSESAELKPTPSVVVDTTSEITDADLRKAMNDCRRRILGDNINDAILKKAVNDNLREKVASFGRSTSIELNQEERVKFVDYCESLQMETSEEPF